MIGRDLLEMIWRGAVTPARGADCGRLARMFRALVPVQAVLLSAECGIDRVAVLKEEIELMPLLPLGDVIVEELSTDVPYGALVILREAPAQGLEASDADLSYDLGLIVGETLLAALRGGLFPMERETDALYCMAVSFDRLVEASGFRHLGVVPERFREGLAGVLGAYWAGVRDCRAEVSGLFDRSDFLHRPELTSYLKQLDGNFHGRPRGAVPAALMHFPGGVRSFDDWLAAVDMAVTPVIRAQRSATGPGLRRAV
jgi:hypothetical protein